MSEWIAETDVQVKEEMSKKDVMIERLENTVNHLTNEIGSVKLMYEFSANEIMKLKEENLKLTESYKDGKNYGKKSLDKEQFLEVSRDGKINLSDYTEDNEYLGDKLKKSIQEDV